MIAAAETTGCEAVHPGYGFLAENPAFARACADNDLVFVGPSPEVMERLGDKASGEGGDARGRRAARPRHRRARRRSRRSARRPSEIGFPVLLKATAGGGGKGMRLVDYPDGLDDAFARCVRRGRGGVRRRLALPREGRRARPATSRSRCCATRTGGVLTLGERECSIQRRHQKLVEESPSPALSPETREEMEAAVERACRAVGYVGAGTFEFLLGPEGEPYFIEVNCRLQVEHPGHGARHRDRHRARAGADRGRRAARARRVARRAAGTRSRSGSTPRTRRAASRPSPGVVERFRPPLGPGVRVDTAVDDGRGDPAVLRLDDREGDRLATTTGRAAIARAVRALEELEVEGIPTTRELALDVLRSDGFAIGRVLDRLP